VNTDFFVASPEEIAAIDVPARPAGVKFLAAKHVDPLKIEHLERIVTGSSTAPPPPARDAGPGGPWIVEVPERLEAALAKAPRSALGDVSRRWVASEEWKLDGGTAPKLERFLGELAQLCSRAQAVKKRVWLWMTV
jgi:hypothetical protein